MKKTILGLMAITMLLFVVPTQTIANESAEKNAAEELSTEAIADAKADINQMAERLVVINEMDIKSMDRAEKKELRKEVRSIKKDLKAYGKSDSPAVSEAAAKAERGAGIYISGGAIIVILLLILLL